MWQVVLLVGGLRSRVVSLTAAVRIAVPTGVVAHVLRSATSRDLRHVRLL